MSGVNYAIYGFSSLTATSGVTQYRINAGGVTVAVVTQDNNLKM